jgi:hypothetical protein
VLLLLVRPYPYTGVGYMGNKPYVLDGLLSWLSRFWAASKSVQTMILLENFLRPESARGRRYVYLPRCREGLYSEARIQPGESLCVKTGAKGRYAH